MRSCLLIIIYFIRAAMLHLPPIYSHCQTCPTQTNLHEISTSNFGSANFEKQKQISLK